MIAAILTSSPSCYSVRQLSDVGQLRGHEMVVVDCRDCFEKSFGQESESASFVDSCARFEAYFAWLSLRDLSCGLTVMRECETSGAYFPNTSEAVTCACDRLRHAQTLAQAAIPMPHAVIAHSTDNIAGLLDSVGEGPWVLKLFAGPHSFDQIVVAETRKAALLALDHFRKLDRTFLVQRYIAEANRQDIRVLVVGGRAVATVMRRATGGAVLPTWSFSAKPSELSPQECHLAEGAASALNLAIADVTLLRSKNEPYVLDVNPFPQLQWWDHHAPESTACRLFELIEVRTAGH